MAAYPPPNGLAPIFNPSEFPSSDSSLNTVTTDTPQDITATKTFTTSQVFGAGLTSGDDILLGNSTLTTAATASRTVTFPDASGTVAYASDIPTGVVTLDGTQTLTNKTLTAPTILSITNAGSVSIPPGSDVLINGSGIQDLFNKTFDTTNTFPRHYALVYGGSIGSGGSQLLSTSTTTPLTTSLWVGSATQFGTIVAYSTPSSVPTFTVGSAGVFWVHFAANFTASTGGRRFLRINCSDGQVADSICYPSSSTTALMSVSGIFALAAGVTVTSQAEQTSGSDLAITTGIISVTRAPQRFICVRLI